MPPWMSSPSLIFDLSLQVVAEAILDRKAQMDNQKCKKIFNNKPQNIICSARSMREREAELRPLVERTTAVVHPSKSLLNSGSLIRNLEISGQIKLCRCHCSWRRTALSLVESVRPFPYPCYAPFPHTDLRHIALLYWSSLSHRVFYRNHTVS